MENLLTIKEVSEILRTGKTNKFVYSLIKKGTLPSARIGNKILIKEDDVNEYIEKMFKK